MSVSVELTGLTTIEATSGVASGAVLPHDQPARATATAIASVRPLLMLPLLRALPHTTATRAFDVDRLHRWIAVPSPKVARPG